MFKGKVRAVISGITSNLTFHYLHTAFTNLISGKSTRFLIAQGTVAIAHII